MSGYGNHSCDDCISNSKCPINKFGQDASVPNSCSFYWPPNADTAPSEMYWKELGLIAQAAQAAKANTALERDGVLVIETGEGAE